MAEQSQIVSLRPSVEEEASATEDVIPFDFGHRPNPRDTPEEAEARRVRETHIFVMHQPKLSIMLRLARTADVEDNMSMLGVFDDFIDASLDPDDRAFLRAQLDDPDLREWDYTLLLAMSNMARDRWYPTRPTGRSSGSSGPRRTSGKRSTVRSR